MAKIAALVTGASSGIGKEFARIAADDGYDVILTARSKDKLKELQEDLSQDYPEQKFSVIVADLSKPGVADKLYNAVSKKYSIELLFNNAGFGDYAGFIDADPKKIDNMINLNVLALTSLAQAAAGDMADRRKGYILNVASVAAFFPGPKMATYYATKAYVLSLSEAMSIELADKNVVVSCLCPGATQSNFDEGANMSGKSIFKNKHKLPTSKEVAEYGYAALVKNKPVVVHGLANKIVVQVRRILPRFVIRKLVSKAQTNK